MTDKGKASASLEIDVQKKKNGLLQYSSIQYGEVWTNNLFGDFSKLYTFWLCKDINYSTLFIDMNIIIYIISQIVHIYIF